MLYIQTDSWTQNKHEQKRRDLSHEPERFIEITKVGFD